MTTQGSMPGNAITVRDVSKRFRLYTDKPTDLKQMVTRLSRARYEEFWALRDISLEVPKGESFGLVGHNGSGKSTLLRLMARIHQPTSGKVTTEGRVSALLELGAGFHPELSGRENIYLNGAILGLRKRDLDAVFDEIVEFAGLQTFIDSPVKVYSSGMYVRLGFAVAVHVDPSILMVDEVIAVGDEEFQRRCMDHLFKLRREGVTIVLVSHGLSVLQNLCDRLALLDHGVLQAIGDPADVVRRYLKRVDDVEEHRRAVEVGADVVDFIRAPGEASGEIKITRFEVLGPDGEEVVMPETGSSVTFRVHYDAREPIDDPRFGIAFHAENGVLIAARSTETDRIRTGRVEGTGYVDLRVDDLQFSPSVLLISLGITDDHESHTYDHLYHAYELRVRQGPDDPEDSGLVRLRGAWSSPVPDHPAQLLR